MIDKSFWEMQGKLIKCIEGKGWALFTFGDSSSVSRCLKFKNKNFYVAVRDPDSKTVWVSCSSPQMLSNDVVIQIMKKANCVQNLPKGQLKVMFHTVKDAIDALQLNGSTHGNHSLLVRPSIDFTHEQ